MSGEITLRAGNAVRRVEWSNGGGDGPEFHAAELFGEAGEALNVIKKLERERLGMVGSRSTEQELAEELADVAICLDLLALAYDRDKVAPYNVAIDTFDDVTPLRVSIYLGRSIGQLMGWVERLEAERELFGLHPATLADFDRALSTSMMFLVALANGYDMDLRKEVVAKFNKTSVKYGLTTMLAEDASLFG